MNRILFSPSVLWIVLARGHRDCTKLFSVAPEIWCPSMVGYVWKKDEQFLVDHATWILPVKSCLWIISCLSLLSLWTKQRMLNSSLRIVSLFALKANHWKMECQQHKGPWVKQRCLACLSFPFFSSWSLELDIWLDSAYFPASRNKNKINAEKVKEQIQVHACESHQRSS